MWVVVLLATLSVAAQPWSEEYPAKWQEERWQKAEERWREAVKNFEKAREEIMNRTEIAKQRMLEAHKRAMLAWTNATQAWIERFEARIDTLRISDEAKEVLKTEVREIAQKVEQLKVQIAKANTSEEIRSVAAQLREQWREMHREMVRAVHFFAVAKLEEALEKLKQVRDRLESFGVDMSELESKIEDLEERLQELNETAGEPGFSESYREFVAEFREAAEIVKEKVREAKPSIERGFLYAKVNGTFAISGNFSSVLIKGWGNVSINEDAVVNEKVVPGNGMLVIVARGNVSAEGDGNFRIVAHGSGSAEFSGEGYYRVKERINVPVGEETPINGTVEVAFGVAE